MEELNQKRSAPKIGKVEKEGIAMDTTESKTLLDDVLAWQAHMVEAKERLRNEAVDLIDGYYKVHFAGNKGRPYWEKSVMGVRVNNGANGDFYTAWTHSRWFKGRSGKMIPRTSTINKGQGFHYPRPSLKRHAKPWEVDCVLAVEDGLAAIREQMHCIKNMERTLRKLCKLRVASGEVSNNECVDEAE